MSKTWEEVYDSIAQAQAECIVAVSHCSEHEKYDVECPKCTDDYNERYCALVTEITNAA